MKPPIEYKKSQFFCDTCQKMHRGSGAYVPSLNKAFCTKHYQEAMKELFKNEK